MFMFCLMPNKNQLMFWGVSCIDSTRKESMFFFFCCLRSSRLLEESVACTSTEELRQLKEQSLFINVDVVYNGCLPV